MTLQKLVLFSFAALTLAATTASALPRGPGGGRGPSPIPRPHPGNPGHQNPGPGYPGPGPGYPGNPGSVEARNIFIGQRVGNTDLPLRQLGRIGDDYRGYEVDSVIVEVRGADRSTQLTLVTDGRANDTSAYGPQGRVVLKPRFGSIIGRDFTNLVLSVRGVADIGTITVNLINRGGYQPGPNPYPPGPGYAEYVYVNVSRRMFGVDRFELTPYIDMYRYRGWRIESVDVEASALYNNALLDLSVNGYSQSQPIGVDRFRRVYSIRPYNAVIDFGTNSIALGNRGDVDIHRVTLRLVR